MAFAFVQSASASADGTGTSLNVTVSSTGAGNLIVIYVGWEGAAGSTISVSDGTSSFTLATLKDATDNHAQFLYLLVSNSGKTTITVTWSLTRTFRRAHVWEFSYTDTASLDVESTNTATNNAPTSGVVTTTGTDEVVLGCYKEYAALVLTSPLINAVAAAGSISNSPAGSYSSTWYRILTATFTNGAATGTLSTGAALICNLISFKAEAAPGGLSIPIAAYHYRYHLETF